MAAAAGGVFGHVGWRTTGGFDFYLQGVFCWYLGMSFFGVGTGHWIVVSWGLDIILGFPNFLRSSYVVRELVRQFVYSSLLQIIRLRFACGER